jgi:hypothetical protein
MAPTMSFDPGDPDPDDPSAIDGAQPQTSVVWLPADDFPEILLFAPLRVDNELVLAFTANTKYIARAEIESLARAVESLLIASADGDVLLAKAGDITGIEPVDRGSDWLCVDSCWVHLAAVQQLILEATTTPAAAVFPAEQDHHLIAYLTATDAIRTPQQAHLACMGLLPERHTAMTPGHYVLCDGIPEDPTDELSWQKLEIVAEGDGRDYTVKVAAPLG